MMRVSIGLTNKSAAKRIPILMLQIVLFECRNFKMEYIIIDIISAVAG
jgi:hypothetical protein